MVEPTLEMAFDLDTIKSEFFCVRAMSSAPSAGRMVLGRLCPTLHAKASQEAVTSLGQHDLWNSIPWFTELQHGHKVNERPVGTGTTLICSWPRKSCRSCTTRCRAIKKKKLVSTNPMSTSISKGAHIPPSGPRGQGGPRRHGMNVRSSKFSLPCSLPQGWTSSHTLHLQEAATWA